MKLYSSYCYLFSWYFNFGKLFTDGNFLVRMIVSDLESPTNRASFAKDLHVAPPNSFVVKLAEVIGSFTTPSRMALFWCRIVDEVSYSVAYVFLYEMDSSLLLVYVPWIGHCNKCNILYLFHNFSPIIHMCS